MVFWGWICHLLLRANVFWGALARSAGVFYTCVDKLVRRSGSGRGAQQMLRIRVRAA